MDIVRASIEKPVAAIVGVVLVVLFGYLGLVSMPVQLSPSVVKPEITIETLWTGATPYEVEREIIEEQEKVLKGIPGLEDMESTSRNSQGEIVLTFSLDTAISDALLRVSNKLDEVPSYPDTAEKPVISATGSSQSPVIWMIMHAEEGSGKNIDHYKTFFEEEVRQYIERVDGVADLFVFGGTEDEMHVILDPERMAAHRLSYTDAGAGLISALQAENVNVSAGNMQLGRREYRIRTVGEFQTPEEIKNVVIYSDGQRRITVGDVAEVEYGYEKEAAALLHNGDPGIVCGVQPIPGTNILDMTDAMEAVVNELNATILAEEGVSIHWAYDQRPYINGAIDLVQQNILIGAALAVIVLLTFLRSISSTVVVAVAIPISVLGTFIFMNMLGRNLNVISLAGISFAVGMLVDNAIVVLENIDRHRSMGKKAFRASYDGAKEVWGAVIASTATTVAVFLPVVLSQDEAGQLFKDIAIAVTAAIIISMFVSVSVIPMLTRQLYRFTKAKKSEGNGSADKLGSMLSGAYMGCVRLAVAHWFMRIVTIVTITAVSIGLSYVFFPKMEYLPQGNRNLLLNILIPPPGLSYQERMDIGHQVYAQLEPLMGKDEVPDGQGGTMPGIEETFYVGADQIMLFGVIATQEQRAAELIPFLTKTIFSIPGMYGVSLQSGIFEQGIGEGRSIDVDVSGASIEAAVAAGGAMYGAISQAMPGSQIRPLPSLELLFPEVKLIPDRDRMRAAGLTAQDLGIVMDVLMDGRKIGDFKAEGQKTIDLVLKSGRDDAATPEELYNSLIVTGGGELVPISSLARMERTTGINEIRHLERNRTITLRVTPPPNIPLQEAMETIQSGVVPSLEKMGLLQDLKVNLSGAADKLTETQGALQGSFLLAVLIIYLLMAALFGNFIYPLVILFTVPLASAGGVLGLTLQNLLLVPQPMDVLTMLGFIILIGVVVNNGILIVHQSLNNIREGGMQPKDAVFESIRTRLRPIYMSATTSVFGMLPLAVAPGPGSELYRGLGSVVLGGLAISTIFTTYVIPALLLFVIGMEKPPVQEDGENPEGETAPPEAAKESTNA